MEYSLQELERCYMCMINNYQRIMPCDKWDTCDNQKVCKFLGRVADVSFVMAQLSLVDIFEMVGCQDEDKFNEAIGTIIGNLLDFGDQLGLSIIRNFTLGP